MSKISEIARSECENSIVKMALKYLHTVLGVAIFGVVCFAVSSCCDKNSLKALGVGLLVLTGFFGLGGFFGLLFSVPRVNVSPNTPKGGNSNSSSILQNNNLVEISDWLTKAIIGASMVGLMTIVNGAYDFGMRISSAMMLPHEVGAVPGLMLIVSGFIAGFFVAYLWVRVLFVSAVDSVNRLLMGDATKNSYGVQAENKELGELHKGTEVMMTDNAVIKEIVDAIHNNVKDQSIGLKGDPVGPAFKNAPSEVNRLRLLAKFTPIADDSNYWSIQVILEDLSKEGRLGKEVVFFLHPSFPNSISKVPVKYNRAEIKLVSWGGDQTVGTYIEKLDDGPGSKLALYIADAAPDSVPETWKSR